MGGMRVPVNLAVFLAVGGALYGIVLPKKAAFTHDLIRAFHGGPVSREDSAKAMVEARIRVDLCPQADLAEYKPGAWMDYYAESAEDASITHEFFCDAQARKFLFRLHAGVITEIVDLR
jgi:hypothetical protein